VRGIDPPILSLPGISELSAAVILSEFGDFSKFDSPSIMLSFAGLEPGYYQSGQSEHTGHMVKHGSSQLRYALMNCCLPLVNHEPIFAEYYAKKRAEGKPHRVAKTHVAKKLLRVIYTLQTRDILYDPSLLR
jgi:transposase